ncbi:MAG: hypothetical protein RTU92_11300 [Candidatus Thorarchaeota archaeon]
MVNYLRDLPPGPDPPSEIYVVVEMTRASKNKFEYDTKYNVFFELGEAYRTISRCINDFEKGE